MENGNVAGYAGSTYNPSTNTYTVGNGFTLVGGSDVGDLIAPSTTTTIHPPIEAVVEETTTTTTIDPQVMSAVFGLERVIPARVSTKTTITRRVVKKKPIVKKPVVKKPLVKKKVTK
jgi:hypothetical protein